MLLHIRTIAEFEVIAHVVKKAAAFSHFMHTSLGFLPVAMSGRWKATLQAFKGTCCIGSTCICQLYAVRLASHASVTAAEAPHSMALMVDGPTLPARAHKKKLCHLH